MNWFTRRRSGVAPLAAMIMAALIATATPAAADPPLTHHRYPGLRGGTNKRKLQMSKEKTIELIVRILIGAVTVGIVEFLLNNSQDFLMIAAHALFLSAVINIVFYFIDLHKK